MISNDVGAKRDRMACMAAVGSQAWNDSAGMMAYSVDASPGISVAFDAIVFWP